MLGESTKESNRNRTAGVVELQSATKSFKMAYMHKKVALILKLPQLQNLIKRDPEAYKEEFMMQKRHFESELEIFRTRPTKDSDRFTGSLVISFILLYFVFL